MSEKSKNTLKNLCVKAIESYIKMNSFGLGEENIESMTTSLLGCELEEYPEYIFDIKCKVTKKKV